MASLRLALRLMTIQRVLVRYGLDEIVTSTHLFRPLRWLKASPPRRAGDARARSRST